MGENRTLHTWSDAGGHWARNESLPLPPKALGLQVTMWLFLDFYMGAGYSDLDPQSSQKAFTIFIASNLDSIYSFYWCIFIMHGDGFQKDSLFQVYHSFTICHLIPSHLLHLLCPFLPSVVLFPYPCFRFSFIVLENIYVWGHLSPHSNMPHLRGGSIPPFLCMKPTSVNCLGKFH